LLCGAAMACAFSFLYTRCSWLWVWFSQFSAGLSPLWSAIMATHCSVDRSLRWWSFCWRWELRLARMKWAHRSIWSSRAGLGAENALPNCEIWLSPTVRLVGNVY